MDQISSDPAHRFYHPEHIFCSVFLNDVFQKYCIVADAIEGYVVCYQEDPHGNGVALDKNFEPVQITLTGKVCIIIRKPNDARLDS